MKNETLQTLSASQSRTLINEVLNLLKKNPVYIHTLIESLFEEGNPDSSDIKKELIQVIKSQITPQMVGCMMKDSIDNMVADNSTGICKELNKYIQAEIQQTVESVTSHLIEEELGNNLPSIIENTVKEINVQAISRIKDFITNYTSSKEFINLTAQYINNRVESTLDVEKIIEKKKPGVILMEIPEKYKDIVERIICE